MMNQKAGIIYGVASSICFALMAVSVKKLNGSLNSQNIVFLRSIGHIILLLPILNFKKSTLNFKVMQFAWYRSFFGCFSIFIYYYSLGRIPVSDATLIIDTSPIFVFLISSIFLGHLFNVIRLVSLLCFLIGLFFLKKYDGFESDQISYFISFLGPLALSVSFIFLKKSSHALNPYQILFALNISLLVFSVVLSGHNVTFLNEIHFFLYLLLMIISSFAAQITLSYSFKHLDEVAASTITLLSVLWTCIADMVLWKSVFSLSQVLLYFFFISGIILMKISYKWGSFRDMKNAFKLHF